MESSRTTSLLKGMSVQTLVTIVMSVLELAYFAIMSRLLTKMDFGYFAAITGVMAICMSLSEAGLGSAVIQKKEASDKHISTAFTLSLLLGLVCMLLLFILSPWIASLVADDTLTKPLQLMSSTILLHSLISVGNAILYRQLNFKRIGVNMVVAYLLSSCVSIAMAYAGYGLYAIVAANVLNSVILFILLFFFSIKFPQLKIYKGQVKSIVSFGGWLTIGVLLNNISIQLDKLVLSKWLSVESLGVYNRPAGFVSTINNKIHSIFDTVLFPMLSEIQDDREKVTQVFFRAISLLNSFSIVLAVIFFFNAELITTIFFGKEWLDVVPIMQIAALGTIFSIDNRLVDCFFRSLNYVKIGTQLRAIGVVITLISIYIGAQSGIIGVTWGIFVSQLILVLIKMITLAVKVDAKICTMITTLIRAWRPAVIPTIMGVIYGLFPHSVFSNVIFATLLGFVLVLEFGFFPSSVGAEYQASVYPIVEKIKKRILK